MCRSGFHVERVETETVEMYSHGDKYGSSVLGMLEVTDGDQMMKLS